MYVHLIALPALAIALSTHSPFVQATEDISLRVMAVMFAEAPPGRDKNLAPLGASGTLEKVEVTAVASLPSGHFTEPANSFFDKGDVRVTAVYPDKSSQGLGQAEFGGFPRFSADARARSFTLVLNRLPDKPVAGLIFEGTVPLSIAKGTNRAVHTMDPARPGPFKLGAVEIRQIKVDGKSLELQGNDELMRIKTLALMLPSGQTIKAERSAWGRLNDQYSQTWTFDTTLSRGELQTELYEGMETLRKPVRFVIGRPW